MMVVKKKTVSEVNMIVESLKEKVENLALKVKKMEALEEKIKHLEDELKGYKTKESEGVKSKRVQERVLCSKCEDTFATKKMLMDHIKAHHFRDIICSDCDLTFDEQWKLEKHLSTEHGKEKTFDCDHCDKSFYTKWRLRKHVRSHDDDNMKFCHYFNNSKKCPYEEFGCRFRHAQSAQCKFENNCENRLCQFRHQNDPGTWTCKELNWEGKSCQFRTIFEVRFKNHSLAEHGIGDMFDCDHCDFQVGDRGKLRKHIEEQHQTKYVTCSGNCSDRMYEENTFKCVNCESILCMNCAQSDNSELCWGCDNLLSD